MLRPPFVFWASLLGLGWSAAIFMLAFDIFEPSGQSLLGREFTNLWVAGRIVIEGKLDYIYDPALFQFELLRHLGINSPQNYSYPPHACSSPRRSPGSRMPITRQVAACAWPSSAYRQPQRQ
jgi:hypothetical protein